MDVAATYLESDDRTKQEKFTLQSGEEITPSRKGLLSLAVKDTGAGMTQEQLNDLFQDGVQFNVNRLQGGSGTGLGLFISKGIVEQHGGALTVASEGLGLGTTFTVFLPLYHIIDTVEPEESHCSIPEEPVEMSPLRILIVDDAISNRKLLHRILTKHGHECDQAGNGREAVDRVVHSLEEGHPYDTILMDYEMPIMDGPTASKVIRCDLGCDAFIVGTTGNVLPEDVKYFKSCGVNNVLGKPFQIKELEELWVEYGITGRRNSLNGRGEITNRARSVQILSGMDAHGLDCPV